MNEKTSPIAAGQPASELGPNTDIQSGPAPTGPPAPTVPSVKLPVRPRFWPAAIFVAVMWIMMKVPMWLEPGSIISMVGVALGPAVGVFGFLGSWLFLSRIPWRDRWLGILACALAFAVCAPFLDESFRWLGIAFFAPPIVVTAWLLWFLITPFLNWPTRRVGMAVVLGAAWGFFLLLRWNGVDGILNADLAWRTVTSAEERFLADRKPVEPLPASTVKKLTLQPGDWPAFRGANRDGKLLNVRINSDWEQAPPKLLWKHRIGKGWASTTIIGKRLYTQYQLDKEEATGCFDTDTGRELWTHTHTGRFDEKLGGIGPRATPTFHDGKIYAMGAVGTLDCLDAITGKLLWSRDIRRDADAELPIWGFSSSPLIVENIVMVYGGGPDGKTLLGYKADTGDIAWKSGEGRMSYSSPQPARLKGVDQVLLLTEKGLASYTSATGKVLWKHDWSSGDQVRCVQPAVIDDSSVLLGSWVGFGTRKVTVRHEADNWQTTEDWTSMAIKPYYNDLVIYKGHAYGFDSKIFTCVDLANGKGTWRNRGEGDGYGNGQVLLLEDQGLLLILSERGEVSLVEANPAEHNQLPGRFQAFEGKTWNHPVIAHGRLFVRNSDWMACYELRP